MRIRATFPEGDWEAVSAALRDRCGDNLPLVAAGFADDTRAHLRWIPAGGGGGSTI